jgi:hypothetical protein
VAFIIRDPTDGSMFFTTVDVSCTEEMASQLLDACASDDDRIMAHTADRAAWIGKKHLRAFLFGRSEDPAAGGESPHRDVVDEFTSGRAVKMFAGEKISFDRSRLVSSERKSPFLEVAAESSWGKRARWRYHPESPHFEPAAGRFELLESENEELAELMDSLAEYLYGSKLFRKLFAINADFRSQRKATFLLLLVADSDRNHFALEYDMRSCSFISVAPTNPRNEYLCGIECFAADLLAVFRGEFEPRILSLGHSRVWCQDSSVPDAFMDVIWPFFHPLRWPHRCLARYREQVKSLPVQDFKIIRNRSSLSVIS